MQTYVYIVAATKEGKRDHNEANAERVRFSLENLVQPAFLAKKENAQTRQGALEQAEVLAAIETAPRPIMRAALAAHFVNGMHWSRVAYALGYGEDNMYKLLNAALQAMTFPAGVE